jgi:hypothetical protein
MSPTSLRDLLADFDDSVDEILQGTVTATTGTDRVQMLHRLRRAIAVHDSVIESVLCPLLDELPDGSPVADQLRAGCVERAELLSRFQRITDGVAARNVYPVSRTEVDEILKGLEESFRRHKDYETASVTDVLNKSSKSTDPEVLSALMVLEAKRAPTRGHRGTVKHPDAPLRKIVYHYVDKVHNWTDTHHGWSH